MTKSADMTIELNGKRCYWKDVISMQMEIHDLDEMYEITVYFRPGTYHMTRYTPDEVQDALTLWHKIARDYRLYIKTKEKEDLEQQKQKDCPHEKLTRVRIIGAFQSKYAECDKCSRTMRLEEY